jgi:hypothetical protein
MWNLTCSLVCHIFTGNRLWVFRLWHLRNWYKPFVCCHVHMCLLMSTSAPSTLRHNWQTALFCISWFCVQACQQNKFTQDLCFSISFFSLLYVKDFMKAVEENWHCCVASYFVVECCSLWLNNIYFFPVLLFVGNGLISAPYCVQKVLIFLCSELLYLYQSDCFVRLLGAHIHFLHLKMHLC